MSHHAGKNNPAVNRKSLLTTLVGFAGAIVLMILVSTFFSGDENETIEDREEVVTVKRERYMPRAVRPVVFVGECLAQGPRLDPRQAARDSIHNGGNDTYTVWWTGERNLNLLDFSGYQWPNGADSVRIKVSYLDGHLDSDNSENSADHPGQHFFAEVTRPRDYGQWTYCPVQYNLPRCKIRLGPGQTSLVFDFCLDPKKGIYPFSDFGGDLPWVTIGRNEQVVLYYNNHIGNPPNGRRHRASFRFWVRPCRGDPCVV